MAELSNGPDVQPDNEARRQEVREAVDSFMKWSDALDMLAAPAAALEAQLWAARAGQS